MSQTGTTTISCTIPKPLGEKLNFIAELEERNKSYYVKKALESFLEERFEDAMLIKMGENAYQEFIENCEEAIPFSEVKKQLLDK